MATKMSHADRIIKLIATHVWSPVKDDQYSFQASNPDIIENLKILSNDELSKIADKLNYLAEYKGLYWYHIEIIFKKPVKERNILFEMIDTFKAAGLPLGHCYHLARKYYEVPGLNKTVALFKGLADKGLLSPGVIFLLQNVEGKQVERTIEVLTYFLTKETVRFPIATMSVSDVTEFSIWSDGITKANYVNEYCHHTFRSTPFAMPIVDDLLENHPHMLTCDNRFLLKNAHFCDVFLKCKQTNRVSIEETFRIAKGTLDKFQEEADKRIGIADRLLRPCLRYLRDFDARLVTTENIESLRNSEFRDAFMKILDRDGITMDIFEKTKNTLLSTVASIKGPSR